MFRSSAALVAGHVLYQGSGLCRLGHKIWQGLRASPVLSQRCRTNMGCISTRFGEREHLDALFSLAVRFGEPVRQSLDLHLRAGHRGGSEVQATAWHACPGPCVAVLRPSPRADPGRREGKPARLGRGRPPGRWEPGGGTEGGESLRGVSQRWAGGGGKGHPLPAAIITGGEDTERLPETCEGEQRRELGGGSATPCPGAPAAGGGHSPGAPPAPQRPGWRRRKKKPGAFTPAGCRG